MKVTIDTVLNRANLMSEGKAVNKEAYAAYNLIEELFSANYVSLTKQVELLDKYKIPFLIKIDRYYSDGTTKDVRVYRSESDDDDFLIPFDDVAPIRVKCKLIKIKNKGEK